MRAPRVQDLIDFVEKLAPLDWAEDWDNVGLLLGDREAEMQRVMTCLTVTPAAVAEAIAENVSLIVSHHPILFRPVQRITTDSIEGRMLRDLIGARVAVYSPHTAYDNAEAGINQQLAERLGLEDLAPLRNLRPAGGSTGFWSVRSDAFVARQYKLVVFVPEDAFETLARALFDAGAGRIGEYSECSFRTRGTGTFFGSDDANPAVGEKGRREEVAEYRLEALCPRERLAAVTTALRRAHPYEEPAFDVYPLVGEAVPPDGQHPGAGRHGRFATPVTTGDLIQRINRALNTSHVGHVGSPDTLLTTLAVACGSAGDFLHDAARAGCDGFLTGEARFHTCLDAQSLGITLLLPGHYATERFAVETLADRIKKRFPQVPVHASRSESDPLNRH